MIKKFHRFLFFVFVFGCCASANFLKASAEETFPHITMNNLNDIPEEGGVFTFDVKKLVDLNKLPQLFFSLGNDGVIPHYDGKQNVMLDLGTLPIFAEFHPANNFDSSVKQLTTVFIPGSGGMLGSEEKEVQRLVAEGQNVFTLMVNYSYEHDKGKVKTTDSAPKEMRITNPLNANPLRQVAASMHIMKLIQNLPFVGDLTLRGRSFGAVSALLAAQQEFSGPLTPQAGIVKYNQEKFDFDMWYGVPKFTVVASSPLMPIMPLSPHFSGKVIIFAGSEDTYCSIQSVIHALQKSTRTLNIVFEILEGVGHFPESDKAEYERLAQKTQSVKYRPDYDDFLFEKDQNLSGACFRLAQTASFFTMDPEKTGDDEMDRISVAKFIHHGTGPWEEGQECSFFEPKGIQRLIDALEPGTTIKPDPIAKAYIERRTKYYQGLSDVEFTLHALSHHHSLQGVKQLEDIEGYDGFVTKKQMLLVSKGKKLDENDLDESF